MADAKALFTQRFDAARAALTKGDEPAAAESLHSAIVVARSDPSLRRELASALFHLGRLSRKFGRAGEVEAETLLNEALAISEELFGREHAALAPLLNELGRLHIHRLQYAGAAGVLERLLAIARAKGEENADVATALAGLAVVKRKLGEDASAEALYRDALRIREKVLEPSHMVTVVTMEHLSETCAARGNFDEALALLRRALATREVALGPGHATVQAARSRVAELELQAAVAADTAAAAVAKAARGAIATPIWLKRVPGSPANTPSTILPSPVNSPKMEFVKEPELRVLPPAALSRDRSKTPTVTAAVAAASLMASSIQMPSASQTPAASQIAISPPSLGSARPSASVPGRESGVPQHDAVPANVALHDVAVSDVAVIDVARSDVASADVANVDAAVGDWRSSIARVPANVPEWARKNRKVLYASVGVTAVAMAGMLMLRPHAGAGSKPVSNELMAAQRTTATGAAVAAAPLTKTAATATGAAAVVEATGADSLVSASATPARTAPTGQPENRADSAAPELHVPRVKVQLRPINVPTIAVPTISVAPSVDSSVRSATERPRASDTGRNAAGDKVSVPTSADIDRAEAENAITPAKIIGRPPEPRFPDALRARQREGEVVVRFRVDEFGRVDVGSMIVERSDNDLFTAAVRDVLPRFRFEPARTRAPESKPVPGWVSVPFRFTTRR